MLSAPPSEVKEVYHLPPGLAATQERGRGCVTEPQVSKPAPGPQIVATLMGGAPHREQSHLSQQPQGRVCPGSSQVVAVPGLAERSGCRIPSTPLSCPWLPRPGLGAWFCTGSNRAAKHPPPQVSLHCSPRSRMKGKGMLICVFANLKRSINSAARRHRSAEGVV